MRGGSSRRHSWNFRRACAQQADLDDPALGFQVDAVVTVEGVGLQVAAIVFQKRGRSVPRVIRRVVEHGQRVERIAHVGPESARVLQLPPGVADLHRSVVGVHDVRSQHHAHGHGVQGLKELGRLEPPAVHRLPRDSHALPLEDPFQAVQGQMVGALAHDDLRHQPRRGQAAGNRLGRLAGHHHVLLRQRQAAFGKLLLAGVFLADMNDDEQRRRPPVELLAPAPAAIRPGSPRRPTLPFRRPSDRERLPHARSCRESGRGRAGRDAWQSRRRGRRRRRRRARRQSLPRRPADRTTRLAADRTSRSCCRRNAAAADACGALAAPERALAFCNSSNNCTTNCFSTAGSSGSVAGSG